MVETIAPTLSGALTWPLTGVNQDGESTLAPSACPAGISPAATAHDVGSGCPAWAATAAKEQLRSPWLLSVIRSAGDAGRYREVFTSNQQVQLNLSIWNRSHNNGRLVRLYVLNQVYLAI